MKKVIEKNIKKCSKCKKSGNCTLQDENFDMILYDDFECSDFIETKEYDKPWLGIKAENIDAEVWKRMEPDSKIVPSGLLFFCLYAKSSFKNIGLSFDKGNFLVEIDGEKVDDSDSLIQVMSSHHAGQVVSVVINTYDETRDTFISNKYYIVLYSKKQYNDIFCNELLDLETTTEKMQDYVSKFSNNLIAEGLSWRDFTLYGSSRENAVNASCNYNLIDRNPNSLFFWTYSKGDDIHTERGITIGSTKREVFKKYGDNVELPFNPIYDELLKRTISLYSNNGEKIDSLGDFDNLNGDETYVEYSYEDKKNTTTCLISFYFDVAGRVVLIGYWNYFE